MERGTKWFLSESEIERMVVDNDSETNLESFSSGGENQLDESGGDSSEVNDTDSNSDSDLYNNDGNNHVWLTTENEPIAPAFTGQENVCINANDPLEIFSVFYLN